VCSYAYSVSSCEGMQASPAPRALASPLRAGWLCGEALELGAGPALPSIVLAARGAAMMVVTDFPERLMQAAPPSRRLSPALPSLWRSVAWRVSPQDGRGAGKYAVEHPEESAGEVPLWHSPPLPSGPDLGVAPRLVEGTVVVEGYKWGSDAGPLLAHTPGGRGFDLLVLSDLLYELEHDELVTVCHQTLRPGGQVYVSFQLHDPCQRERNLAFFDVAGRAPYNFTHREVLRSACRDPLSEDYGLGDNEVSDEVHVYLLERAP
jgi:hypothetical protein